MLLFFIIYNCPMTISLNLPLLLLVCQSLPNDLHWSFSCQPSTYRHTHKHHQWLNNLLRYKNHSIIKNLLFTESIFLFHRRLCCKRYLRIHRENDINSNRDKKFHCRIDVSKLCEFDDYKHILYYKFRCWQKYKTGINI